MIKTYRAKAFIAMSTISLLMLCAFAPAAYADHPMGIKHDKVLRVAFGVERPPFVFEDHESGLEIDLIRAITHHMGYQIKPIFVPNARGYRALKNHEVDIYTIASKEMAADFALSAPYIAFDNVIIARADNPTPINSFADLKGSRLAAFHNAHAYIKALGAVKDELSFYVETPNQSTQVLLLYKNRVDYLFCDKIIFEYYRDRAFEQRTIPKDGFDYKIHRIRAPTYYSSAFNDVALRDQYNVAFKAIIDNGKFESIMRQYDPSFSMLTSPLADFAKALD
tara:strand:- start:301655 stop:302494 length:840 start_codon:yes stop_codon:yes gene_type:complete